MDLTREQVDEPALEGRLMCRRLGGKGRCHPPGPRLFHECAPVTHIVPEGALGVGFVEGDIPHREPIRERQLLERQWHLNAEPTTVLRLPLRPLLDIERS